MGQYASTQPCATKFRRSVCTIFVLDDENGHNISSKKIRNVGSLVNDWGNPGVAEVNPYPYPPKTRPL